MVLSLHDLYLTAGGVPLDVVSGELTMDERRSPFTEARFTVATPSNQDALNALNAKTGEVRGYARIDYRDPVLASRITGWAGATVTAAKVTAAMGSRLPKDVTAMFSQWGNPFVTANGQEWDAEMLPFRLAVTGAKPDPESELTGIRATSLETRLFDHKRLTDGGIVGPGWNITALVSEVIAMVNPAYQLAAVDGRYETVPTNFATTQTVQWKAGVSAWDFIDPIMQAAGVTLQCTPDGLWRLVRANADTFYTIGVDATAVDVAETRDEWGDAVVVFYRWRDNNGVDQVRSDYASLNSTPQKTVVIEHRDVPYPGPGAAVTILNRVQNLAREITVEAVEHFISPLGNPVRPGVAIGTSANGEATNGRMTAVSFDWPSNLMTITARS